MSLKAWSTDPRLQRILTHPDDDTVAWRSDLARTGLVRCLPAGEALNKAILAFSAHAARQM